MNVIKKYHIPCNMNYDISQAYVFNYTAFYCDRFGIQREYTNSFILDQNIKSHARSALCNVLSDKTVSPTQIIVENDKILFSPIVTCSWYITDMSDNTVRFGLLRKQLPAVIIEGETLLVYGKEDSVIISTSKEINTTVEINNYGQLVIPKGKSYDVYFIHEEGHCQNAIVSNFRVNSNIKELKVNYKVGTLGVSGAPSINCPEFMIDSSELELANVYHNCKSTKKNISYDSFDAEEKDKPKERDEERDDDQSLVYEDLHITIGCDDTLDSTDPYVSFLGNGNEE